MNAGPLDFESINPLGVRDAIELVMQSEFELRRTEVHDALFHAVIAQAMCAPTDASAMRELLRGLQLIVEERDRAYQIILNHEKTRPLKVILVSEDDPTPDHW